LTLAIPLPEFSTLAMKKDVALIDATGTSPNIGVNVIEGSMLAKDDEEKDVGVYIVAHGGALKCGGLGAESLFKLLKETLKFRYIRKLCLVSCNLAKSLQPGQKGYLEDLCQRLGDAGLDPKISGYDGFVSVAYEGMKDHIPYKTGSGKYEIDENMTGKKTIKSPQKAKGVEKSKEEILFGSRAGGKTVFVRDINEANKEADEQTRVLHRKRFVWRYVDKEAEVMEEGWSDKT
jgi:hypothetical protein